MTAFESLMQVSERLQATPGLLYGLLGGSLVLGLGAAAIRRRRERRQTTHGSARWATLAEAKRQGNLCGPTGIVLGKLGRQILRSNDRHVLVVGPTGSGKDSGINVPTTLTYPGSMIIVDVKDGGENYARCHGVRRQLGPVYRFAPGMQGSHHYNLLSAVRVGTPHEFRDLMHLIKSLLAPAKKDTRVSDSGAFFERQGAMALRGVLLYVLYTAPPGTATLHACHQIMHDAKACLSAMADHGHPEVRAQGTRLLMLMQTADRQFAGEWSTGQGALDIFSDPMVAAVTDRSDFRLTDLQYGKQPMTLYLGAESPTDVLHLAPVFRAILQTGYHQLTSMPSRWRSRRRELVMLLNEFPELGYMEILERAPAYARSYGMRFLVVAQDVGQLFETYGRQTPLWGNMGTKVFHGPAHDETAARMERMLGTKTEEVMSIHSTRGPGGRSRSVSYTARPLMTQAEILGMPEDEEIIWVHGMEHPLRAEKVRYWVDVY